MDRKEFLHALGIGSAALFATYCLGGCKSDTPTPNELPVDGISLDLNSAQYSSLKNNGAYLVLKNEKIVVAKTTAGAYVAVTLVCSHEGQEQVGYIANKNIFECSAHGAQFDTAGGGLNPKGAKGLRIYRTEINPTGDLLKIFNN